MREMLNKIFSLINFKTTNPPEKRGRSKTRAQSLVEFALTLPIIIILLSGVVEFGFALNFYLSLLDATRESARFYSDRDPFLRGANDAIIGDDGNFYAGAAAMVRASLDPSVEAGNEAYQGRRITLDPGADDIIITVYTASGGSVIQHPSSGPYHLYNNHDAAFTSEAIEDRLLGTAPDTGILVVEIHYHYHPVLGLPWLTMFEDTMLMRAYTIMPNRSAEPD